MRLARDNDISPYVKLAINKVHDAAAVSSKCAQQPGCCTAEGLASGDPGSWTNFLTDPIFYELERSEVDLKRSRAHLFHRDCLAARTMFSTSALQLLIGLKIDEEHEHTVAELRATKRKLSGSESLIGSQQNEINQLSERVHKMEELKVELEKEINALKEESVRATREHELEALRREKEALIAFSTSAIYEESCSYMIAETIWEILSNFKGQMHHEHERQGIDFRWDRIDPVGKDVNGIEIVREEPNVKADRFYPWRDEILQHVERFLDQRAGGCRAQTPIPEHGPLTNNPPNGRMSRLPENAEADPECHDTPGSAV
ncbi:hypothetical protein M569_14567 [Genlisea aurea]|uniref:Uncharacterized protein n=1 Tax=Genlisea aurea TaxID=192259 RepID=S8DBW2_9LAMI|nr:hypothetical protein M569_14567 [Genlisea aurea]